MVVPATPLGSCSGVIRLVRPGFEFQGFGCKLLSYAKILCFQIRKAHLEFEFHKFKYYTQHNKKKTKKKQSHCMISCEFKGPDWKVFVLQK